LVRLAKLKFGRMPSSEALESMLQLLVVPEMVSQMDIPSHEMLRDRAVQCFLFESRAKVHEIYDRYVKTRSHGFKGCDVNDDNLTLPAFLEMLQEAGILGLTNFQAQHRHIFRPAASKQSHGHSSSSSSSSGPKEVQHLESAEESKHIDKLLRQARFAFAAAQNDLDDQIRKKTESAGLVQTMDETLTFEEFMEAIVRMCCVKFGHQGQSPLDQIKMMVYALENLEEEKKNSAKIPVIMSPRKASSMNHSLNPGSKGLGLGGIVIFGKLKRKARATRMATINKSSNLANSVSLPII